MDEGLDATELTRRLEAAVATNPDAQRRWAVLPASHRAAWVNWVSEAKRPETVERRIG